MANTGNHKGGTKILAATYEALTTETYGMRNIHMRNADGNGDVLIADANGKQTGFLNGGEGLTVQNMRPMDIYVKGTAGEAFHFIGDGA